MLEDVAVIHPAARPLIRHPRDADGGSRRDVHDVLPRAPRRWLAVDGEHLEKEAVQMERMIHQRRVGDVPDLQLARLDRLVLMIASAVDSKIAHSPKAERDAELHGAR